MDGLEHVKRLREDYERALDEADARRGAYHEAVLDLYQQGIPLRQIASELGLSHQRVHQIVSSEPGGPRARVWRRAAGGAAGAMLLIGLAFGGLRLAQAPPFGPTGSSRGSEQASFQALSGPTVSLPSGSITPMLQQVGDRSGADAHLVLRSHGSRVFAVASRDGRYVCLAVRKATGATAETCGQRSGLRRDDVIWLRTGVPGRLSDIYGLVPDGIHAVHAGALSATLKNNAFVLTAVPASATTLVVTGNGIDRAVNLGTSENVAATTTMG